MDLREGCLVANPDPMNDDHYDGNDPQIDDLKDLVESLRSKLARRGPRYVHVVTHAIHYEGESVQALYVRRSHADKHPQGGDETRIYKMRILTKAPK